MSSRVLAVELVVLCSSPAWAQQAPGGQDRILPTTREQVAPPPVAPSGLRPPSVQIDAHDALRAAPCPLEGSDVKVSLSSVHFEAAGGGALAPELARLLAPVSLTESGEQPVANVCEIRDRANAALRGAGYIASVQIPPQEIATGELRLIVVTAKIVEVRVTGNLGPFAGVISSRVEQIKQLDPVNAHDIERILLLARDVPGLNVRLNLRPAGTALGEVIGELVVETQRAVVLANVQNTGSRQLGPTILSARGEIYGLTGLADRTVIAYSNSAQFHETHVVQLSHDMGIGSDGVRTGFRSSYALSNPSIANLDLRTRSLVLGYDFDVPLLRTLRKQARFSAGFELLNQRTRFYQSGSSAPFTRDRLRVFYAQFDGQVNVPAADGSAAYHADGYIQLRKGADILDATQRRASQQGYQPTRFDGDPEAFVVRGELNQTVRLVPGLTFNALVFGQWANNPLLNFEEFSLGNLTYGRGYDPGANGADRVIAGRLEPNVRVFDKSGFTADLIGFYDLVKIWNLDPGTIETNRLLESAGGGVRIGLSGRFVLDVTYAQPLDKALTTDMHRPRGRLLVSFTTKLFPWGGR